MKLIKIIASVPLNKVAKVINSLISGDDPTTNAPSIQAVKTALAGKADTSAVDSLANTVAGKADTSTVNSLATTVAGKQDKLSTADSTNLGRLRDYTRSLTYHRTVTVPASSVGGWTVDLSEYSADWDIILNGYNFDNNNNVHIGYVNYDSSRGVIAFRLYNSSNTALTVDIWFYVLYLRKFTS